MNAPIPTPALQALAAARSRLSECAERSTSAHSAQTKLLVLKSESEAAAALAIADHKARTISEEVAALRRASSLQDAADLSVLIQQGAAHLSKVDQEFAQAQAHATGAERDAAREEDLIAVSVLDQQIKTLEANFLSAMSERYRLHIKTNGNRGGQSTFSFYQPTQAMQELIKRNQPPSA